MYIFRLLIVIIIFFNTACLKKGEDFSFVEGSTEDQQENQPGNSAIEFNPVSWDFGPIASYTDSDTKTITISNQSENEILISTISGENDHFKVKSDSCNKTPISFKPNESCTITVEFAPQAPGNLSVTLSVVYNRINSTENLQKSLGLSGQGVSPISFSGVDNINDITHNSMTLNWDVTPEAKSFMVFSIDMAGGLNYNQTVSNTSGNISSTVIDSLTPNTSYKWRVRAIDALGNQETNTKDESATTLMNNPPSLNAIVLANIYSGALVSSNTIDANNVTFNNDIDSDGDQVSYGCKWDQSANNSMDGTAQNCSALINEGGGNPSFGALNGRLSDWTPSHAMATQVIEFEITGQDPYGAQDTIYFSTSINAGTPGRPTVTGINVTSPVNENNPIVAGTSDPNYDIKLYNNSSCNPPAIGTGSTNGAGSFTVQATVPDNAITQIYATATNTIGNESPCSYSSVTIVEDSAPPSPTLVTSTNPASPSTSLTPSIVGTTEANASVSVYSDTTCTNLATTSNADNNGDFSIPVTVNAFTTTTFKVRATDSAGNQSNCSTTFLNYESYSIANGAANFEGDRLISGTNVNPSVASSLQWSLGYYDNSFYAHSSSTQSEKIQILQNGNYLLTLNVPLQQNSAAYGRETPRFEVYINGTAHPAARAESTYIRNASGHEESSAHLSLLLADLNATDIIEVKAIAGAPDLSTVNISNKTKLFLEYIDLNTRPIFSAVATKTTNSTNLSQATPYGLEWTSNKKNNTVYTHNSSSNSEQITLNESGDYLVFVNLPLTSTVVRASVGIDIKLNGSTINGGTAQQGYLRADGPTGNNNSTAHWSGLVSNVAAGQVLQITASQAGANGNVTVAAGTQASIYIEKIDTSTNAISLTSIALTSGANYNPTTEAALAWSNVTNSIHDTNIFSHSTVTNNDEITVLSSGDYLLIYNDSLTSAVQRPNNIIDVKVNNTSVPGGQVKSHYIRASSGHNHSSGSMVLFLRNLQVNDVIKLTSVAEALAGSVTTFDSTLLTILKKR